MAVDATHKILFAGECKYHKAPVDADVYFDLRLKVEGSSEIISTFKGYTVLYGVFSKSGFTARLEKLNSENDQLILINEASIV